MPRLSLATRLRANTTADSRCAAIARGAAAALLILAAPAGAETAVATPAPVPGAVSLRALLAFAERHAPALQVAALRRRYGEAARQGAMPLFRHNPSLEAAVGPRRQGGRARDVDAILSLEQPVEIAGQRGLRRALAERLTERLEAELEATRWRLRRDVVTTYHAARVARERVRTGASLVALAGETLRMVERRRAAGEASAIDVRLAEADEARARQARVLAERDLHRLRLELCETTGWPADTPPLPEGGLEPPRSIPDLDTIGARDTPDHPELRARRAAVAEARLRADLADREAWPTPTLGVSVTREGRGESRTEDPSYIVLGAVGLSLPLWTRNEEERGRAHADEAVARAEVSEAARSLRLRLLRAHAEARAAAERLDSLRSLGTPSLEEALRLLKQGVAAGELAPAELAVVRERLLQARYETLSAYEDYYRALAELEYVLGSELPSGPTGETP